MARHAMEDGRIVDTELAKSHWKEKEEWDGTNHVSVITGTQGEHEELFQSSKDNFYLVRRSVWKGNREIANFVTEEAAAKWLLTCGHELPSCLSAYALQVME